MTDELQEPTDAEIERLQHQKEVLEAEAKAAETTLETPTPERPMAFKMNDVQVLDLKLTCVLDFLMPMEGPGASNFSRRERLLMEIYFLSKYNAVLKDAEEAANNAFAEIKSQQLRQKLAVDPAQAAAFGGIFGKPGG